MSTWDFYEGKRVLITGHTGFKGAWLSQILLMAGADLTGYALKPPTEPNLFSALGLEKKMRSGKAVESDRRDKTGTGAAFGSAADCEGILSESGIHL